jgi:hypothetical protein
VLGPGADSVEADLRVHVEVISLVGAGRAARIGDARAIARFIESVAAGARRGDPVAAAVDLVVLGRGQFRQQIVAKQVARLGLILFLVDDRGEKTGTLRIVEIAFVREHGAVAQFEVALHHPIQLIGHAVILAHAGDIIFPLQFVRGRVGDVKKLED